MSDAMNPEHSRTDMDAAVEKAGSQSALGEIIGCSQGLVQRMQKAGVPTPAFALKIAQYLGKPIEEVRPDMALGGAPTEAA